MPSAPRSGPEQVASIVLALATVAALLSRSHASSEANEGANGGANGGGSSRVSFDRDVRPILRDRCYTCHGPDAKKRKQDLRLDRAEGLFRLLDDETAVVTKGDLEHSELYRRISSEDEDQRMPPPITGQRLAPGEIETLRRWIEEGAEWSEHWAFVPPVRSPIPEVHDASWPRGAIDRFVLDRLERDGLAPAPEAGCELLLRRASFDLTGLPPSPAELDRFGADTSPDAYEKALERLLASPRYGERMASWWLDLARYADTNGYHIDNHRDMYKWRDWVVAAFNANVPFDRFTIEQLAGDLLPSPTLEQRVATGFNRNGPINFEGGADPDEYQTKYVVDRVQTTATTWMGLTMGCAECHDHKYDPLSQREFYELYAFFDTIGEKGLDGEKKNPVPKILVPEPAEEARLAVLERDVAAREAELAGPDAGLEAAQLAWESETLAHLPDPPEWRTLAAASALSRNGATLTSLDDGSLLASGANPKEDVYELALLPGAGRITALRLEALTHESLPHGGAGRAENGNFVLTGIEVELSSVSAPASSKLVRLVAAEADHFQEEGGDFQVARAIDADPKSGWAVDGEHRREAREALFVPEAPLELPADGLLRVRVRHESIYEQHAIGRLRLSVTGDAALWERLAPPEADAWRVIGPFAAESAEAALHRVWPPEERVREGVQLDASYPAPTEAHPDAVLEWEVRADLTDGAVHALAPGEKQTLYLHRVLRSAAERDVLLHLGSDDALAVWLDGEEVHRNDVARAPALDQDLVRVRLRKGDNPVLLKIANYGGGAGFAFRIEADSPGGLPVALDAVLRAPAEGRTNEQLAALRDHYRRNVSEPGRALAAGLEIARGERQALLDSIAECMVMEESAEPRTTHVLMRGDFRQKGEQVSPDVPAILPPLPTSLAEGVPEGEGGGGDESRRPTRLDLARWLVSREHPLTARVTVNRLWQLVFGTGLVETAEDLGVRGERPSHPELLDWLALELVDSGWDVKALLKQILTSAAYRQDARVGPELAERDPANRLLARGPRVRLTAEMVRDQALAASGLLVEKLGGPSVRPYQPDGLWEAVAFGGEFSSQVYVQDHGEALWRRALYVYWKRSLPYPSLVTFDAPIRETCTTRRPETITPLQALVLLNDPAFVEAARALATRVLREAGPDPRARLAHAFRLCTSRRPSERELAVLARQLEEQLALWRADFKGAHALVHLGEFPTADEFEAAELAAWTAIANVLLNLDEALHRG